MPMASNSNRFSRLIMIVLLLSFICSLPGKASAETGKEIEEPASVFRAEPVANPPLEYLCSFVSLATYNDRVGLVAREALGDKGWVMQPYREDTKDIAAKYCFLKNSDFPDGGTRYLVSVMGTSDLKDVRTDLSMGKVPFAGHTPEEFLREMNRKTMKSSEPLTHGGFTKYTQTAFFTQKENGLTFGEELKKYLMEEPEAKLCVTGHSLGGAVAVLFAARLIAMGVPSEQIDVVTFGAPAVGNHAFGETYGGMRINRIVMARDPIEIAVQSVDRSYEQLGSQQTWKRPRGSERFMHDMTGYVDAALRLYYDDMTRKRRDVERFLDDGVPYEGDFMRAQEGEIETPRVLLFADYQLDEAIIDDLPYMRLAAFDILQSEMRGLAAARTMFSSLPGENKVAEAARQAKEMGYKYVLIQKYVSERLRNKRYGYKVSLEEALYDVRGNPLVIQSFSTNTDTMTPILAAMYNEVAGRESRQAVLKREK